MKVNRKKRTLAGQTAPGDGIVITHNKVNFGSSENFIVRISDSVSDKKTSTVISLPRMPAGQKTVPTSSSTIAHWLVGRGKHECIRFALPYRTILYHTRRSLQCRTFQRSSPWIWFANGEVHQLLQNTTCWLITTAGAAVSIGALEESYVVYIENASNNRQL